jgi:hypothetical protein
MLMIGSSEIGGGFVRLQFKDSERTYKMGEPLSAEKIKSFHNYKRMIDIGKIAVYPPAPPTIDNAGPRERFVMHTGFGHYDVVEGRKLNENSLTKEEAEKLAAI